MEYEQKELKLVAEILPNVAAQMREALAGSFAAASRIATPSEREKDPKLDQMASVLTKNSYQMIRLLGNLTEAGELFEDAPFYTENDDVVDVCHGIWEKSCAPFESKGVTLEFRSDKEKHIVRLAREKIERLLLNLLSNALKFTPAGGTVTLRVVTSGRFVKIIVSDTGCGIEEDRLERVLHGRADTRRMTVPPHGLGLGLPICRQIARRHGGTIVAESAVGKGASFTVSLPNELSSDIVFRQPRFEYAGGFNRVLVELSDALSSESFLQKYLD